MFEMKSRRKPEEVIQPQPQVQQTQSQPQAQVEKKNLIETLVELREMHEGACLVTLLVSDNEVKIVSTQKVADK